MVMISADTVHNTKLKEKERLRNTVIICVNVYGRQYDREILQEWFLKLCYFKPQRMTILSCTRGDTKRYKEEIFYTEILNERNTLFELLDRDYYNILSIKVRKSSSYFYFKIPMDIWDKNKDRIIIDFESLFIRTGACFGYLLNAFDDVVVQNPNNAREYTLYEVDDRDYQGINEIPVIPDKVPCGSDKIDKSYLPGNRLYYDDMQFTTAPCIWIGPDFYRFFSRKVIESYKKCDENVEIAPDFRRIQLWHDVKEYNNPIYRQRQWDFRKKIKMDETLKKLRSKPFIPKDEKSLPDPTVEINKGKFEHGGELFVKFYYDKKGRACNKSLAYICICREMKGNTIVWQERKKL